MGWRRNIFAKMNSNAKIMHDASNRADYQRKYGKNPPEAPIRNSHLKSYKTDPNIGGIADAFKR